MTKAFDLDAKRAARRESAKEPVTFVFGGETFVLPVEMPVEAVDLLVGVDVDKITDEQAVAMIVPILKALLGPEDWTRFAAHRPTMEDVADLSEFIWGAYGLDPQTPSRSQRRARATGAPSKQTSKRPTGSTRARSSAAN